MVTWLHVGVASGLALGAFFTAQLLGTSAGGALPPNCSNARLAAMLADAGELQLAVAAGSGIPGERRSAYREMAHAAAACAKPGIRVAVRPVTEHGLIEIPIFERTVPDRVGENEYNDVHYQSDVRAFLKGVDEALDRLPGIGARDRGADPLGSLIAASRDVTAGDHALVLIIGNGWQQTRQLNIFAYRTDPSRFVPAALRLIDKNHTPLQLAGVRVVIAGITAGDPIVDATDTQLEGLCTFWTRVIESAHGSLRCGPSLPGFSDRAVSAGSGPAR